MFEIHYEYLCAAGWREHEIKTIHHFDELDAVFEDCEKKGYEIKDNPICVGCALFPEKCPGTRNHIWTGCSERKERETT